MFLRHKDDHPDTPGWYYCYEDETGKKPFPQPWHWWDGTKWSIHTKDTGIKPTKVIEPNQDARIHYRLWWYDANEPTELDPKRHWRVFSYKLLPTQYPSKTQAERFAKVLKMKNETLNPSVVEINT